MKTIVYFLLLLICTLPAYAQGDKNNDCTTARTICGNLNLGLDNINGKGINDFANPNNQNGCMGNENQSAWYVFYIQEDGVLKLDILPNGSTNTDYDFAVFGPNVTCDSLGSPVRCNFAGTAPSTGLKTGGGGAYDDSLDVKAGQYYYILIDNFSNNNQGFKLEWGGTATFVATNTTNFEFQVSCNKVAFTNKTSFCGAVLSYSWDFGDGSPITTQNSLPSPVHAYQTSGTYIATLKVEILASPNPAEVGNTGTFSAPVTIISNPPPVQITNLNSAYCLTDNSFDLKGTPLGGKFFFKKEGAGFFEQTTFFAPAIAGIGKHEIRYEYFEPSNPTCVGVDLRVVEVVAPPQIFFFNLFDDYCITAPPTTLTASPEGGVIKINGVVNNFFDPVALGAGTHLVEYLAPINGTPCPTVLKRTVRVRQPSDIVINYIGLRPAYCVGIGGFTIQVQPIIGGVGVMTIDGIVSTNRFFNTETLGIGMHIVNYTVTIPGGCVNNKTTTIEILPRPTVSFVNLKNTYCNKEPAFALQALPAGGTFTVNNVISPTFNPSALSAGSYEIKYNYRDSNNPTCTNEITQTVKIGIAPTATISTVANEYCQYGIAEIQPQLNVVYGDGTFTTLFPPELRFRLEDLPAGDYTITYPLTDPVTGCVSIFSYTTKILPATLVNFVDLKESYCREGLPTLLRANAMGGVFTIENEAVTALNPANFEVGEVVNILYTYAHPTSKCPTFVEKSITIVDNPYLTTFEKHRLCPLFPPDYFIEAISETEEADLIASGITPTYYWSNGAGNVRKLKIDKISYNGTSEVFVRDANTCPVAKRVFEIKIDCESKLFVPDAFTPNDDNLNPTLKLFGEYVGKLDFKIYNRWGEVVFTGSKITDAWDGKIAQKPAPAGVYIWQASYENLAVRDTRVRRQGKIVLIR